MIRSNFRLVSFLGLAFAAALLPGEAQAASLLALVSHRAALLSFAVCAGLCMREVGLVRRENAFAADIQCFMVFVVSCLAFGLFGLSLALSASQTGALWPGVIGSFGAPPATQGFARSGALEIALAALATQAVSGALAERIRLLPLLIFAALFAALVFPIALSWQSGWLEKIGFVDYAGAAFVHCAAGAAALAGIMVLGGRIGRFDPSHQLKSKEHHSFPLAGLGTLVLLIGWQGLVTGLLSTLPIALSERALSHVLLNLNLSAAAGLVVALIGAFIWHRGRVSAVAFNGVIAGLVAISADPAHPAPLTALVIGGVAGALSALVPIALEKMRLDDVTGAVPAHLCAGAWGTLAVLMSAPGAHFGIQLEGLLAVSAFSFIASLVLFLLLQILFGLRKAAERTSPPIASVSPAA
ncbi:MAG: hypothetical protein WAW96_10025 [Alphaproteobacteria bacterium]